MFLRMAIGLWKSWKDRLVEPPPFDMLALEGAVERAQHVELIARCLKRHGPFGVDGHMLAEIIVTDLELAGYAIGSYR